MNAIATIKRYAAVWAAIEDAQLDIQTGLCKALDAESEGCARLLDELADRSEAAGLDASLVREGAKLIRESIGTRVVPDRRLRARMKVAVDE